jgi:O-antigen/teichoic acid export membrane protein
LSRHLRDAAFDTGATGVLTLAGSMMGLLSVVCLTRWLAPEDYAALGTFVFVGQTARSLLATWPLTAVIHFGKHELLERGDARNTFWSAAVLIAPALLLGLLLSAPVFHRLEAYLGGGAAHVFLLIAYVVMLSVSGLHTHWLQAVGALRLSAGLSSLDRGLLATLAIAMAFAGVASAQAARWALVASVAASLAVGLAVRPPGLPRTERARIVSMTSFSIPIAVGVFAGTLFGWADFWVASRILSSQELGRYYLASQGMAILLQLAMVINTVGGPLAIGLVAEGQTERLSHVFSRGLAQLCLLASCGLGLSMAVLALALPRLLSPAYEGTLAPLVLMSAACATAPAYFLSLAVFNACGRPRLITLATLILGVGNLLLGLAFVPRWGASGAALAKGGSLCLGSVLAALLASRLLRTPGSTRMLFAVAPAPLAAMALFLSPPPFEEAAAVTATVAATWLAVRFGRVLVVEDLRWFERAGLPGWLRSVLAIPLGGAS